MKYRPREKVIGKTNVKSKIAIIDDQPRMAEILSMVLQRDYDVSAFTDSEVFIAQAQASVFDCVITDLKMPIKDGLEVLAAVKDSQPDTPVILLTAHATVDTAIEALKKGAFDYLQKPIDNDRCRQVVALALETTQLRRQNRLMRAELIERYSLDKLIAESQAMQEVIDMVRRAAMSSSTVMIHGESGTGKEVIAKAIHYYSDRVGKPFVAVNCKAFAEGVLESELFGHEKGSFTGANQRKQGVFERAQGGSLFLDEIGETNGDFQAKLLRVIQEKQIQRVGGNSVIDVDFRLIVATNRDLQLEVEQGHFREDLYYRLNVIPVFLPPLRERREDILPLAQQFLNRVNEEQGRSLCGFTPEVESYLHQGDWPGNVRELENVVERGAVLSRSDWIELSDLGVTSHVKKMGEAAETDTNMSDKPSLNLQEHLDFAAKKHICEVLEAAKGVRQLAAKQLGVERTTLYRLIKKYGIDIT